MNGDLIIEERDTPPVLARAFEQAKRNLLWLSENAKRLKVFRLRRGRYVDTADEVRRLAREKHPGEMLHVRYIRRKKLSRIYAN
jgi:hypothetical protein